MNQNKKIILQNILMIVLSLILLTASIVPIVIYTKKNKQQTTTYAAATLNKGADGKYHIASKADLDKFKADMDGGTTYAGETVVLDNNIDYESEIWETNSLSIGFTGKYSTFSGTFDGRGNKIFDMTITNKDNNYRLGFFYIVKNATIKNVWFNNITLKTAEKNADRFMEAGILVSQLEGSNTIDTILITNSNVSIDMSKYSLSTVECGISALIGKIVSDESSTISQRISNCAVNLANFVVNNAGKCSCGIGGLIGYCEAKNVQIEINNSYFNANNVELNKANIVTKVTFGGLVGLIEGNHYNGFNYTKYTVTGTCSNSFINIKTFNTELNNDDEFHQIGLIMGGIQETTTKVNHPKEFLAETSIQITNCAYNKEITSVSSKIEANKKALKAIWKADNINTIEFYQKLGWNIEENNFYVFA